MANEDGFPGLQEPFVAPTINLYVVLDVSPSMVSRWSQTLSGLNEYVDSLRKDQKDNTQDYKVTMVTFSDQIEKAYDGVVLDALPTFTNKNLSPYGSGTALYKAILQTVKPINETGPVLVVILTDGEDNGSTPADEDAVSKLLDERQKLGNYTYAYLGVAKEAWGNAVKLGASMTRSMSNTSADAYTKDVYSGAPSSLAAMTVSYSSMMRSASHDGGRLGVDNFFSQPNAEPILKGALKRSDSTEIPNWLADK